MNREFDTCPYCERKILKGALRCPACRKLLMTPEDQLATIEKLRRVEKRFDFGKFIKSIIVLLALWAVYHFFYDRIIAFIYRFL